MPRLPKNSLSRANGPKTLYVRVMLALLPHLLNISSRFNKRIRAEIAYQRIGYSFALVIRGTDLARIYEKKDSGKWSSVKVSRLTLSKATYTIEFRTLDAAHACFSGKETLINALASRWFTTRGPNNTGVSLTYMFTYLLQAFFGWRAAYKKPKNATRTEA